MAAHFCIGSPCWICHPSHVSERYGFHDLGKLETALSQRDELAREVERLKHELEVTKAVHRLCCKQVQSSDPVGQMRGQE